MEIIEWSGVVCMHLAIESEKLRENCREFIITVVKFID